MKQKKTIRTAPENPSGSKLKPLVYCSILAMGLGHGAVVAQDDEPVLEEITVTGSRIRTTNGLDTPSPVTVVTTEEVELLSPISMVDGLAALPQFFNSSTTQTPSPFFTSVGAGSLNLRGLDSKRTLQLLNGRRVVQSTIFGGPDINLFPENVIKSVETVTGGASAAYGTDAVAGVVNFILDTDYEGFKASYQTGQNSKGDNKNFEYSLGGGFAIGDRTHVLLNYEKAEQDPISGIDVLDYDWYTSKALLGNPDPGAGSSRDNPLLVAYNNAYSRNYSLDGIISGLPSGVQALDSSGNASVFVPGTFCDSNACTGGGSAADSQAHRLAITPETSRDNLFAYVEHDVSDSFSVYAQLISGSAEWSSINALGGGGFGFAPFNFTVFDGNPFLPASIQQEMTDNGIASASFNRVGAIEDIGADPFTTQTTDTDSYTVGFEYDIQGGFFEGWQARGYYQSGETDVKAVQRGGVRLDRIYLAMDAVIDPGTGLPACNVTVVSGLHPDCVPLNLFGRGQASQEAVDWVSGFEPGVAMNVDGFLSATESLPHSYTSGRNKVRVINIQQDVWELSADGEIAEGWGAGPVTMAVGVGAREESFTQVVQVGPGGNVNADPTFRPVAANDAVTGIRGVAGGAINNSVDIQFSNVPFARGEQDVTEAFTEFLVPLVSGASGADQINLNVAARWADYSGAGEQWSWKTGVDWTVNDQVRLRATVSRDVRAASMAEKFDRTGGLSRPNPVDYLADPLGLESYAVTIFSNGSPDIQPEIGKTATFGIVYQPSWLDGLGFTLDFYRIEVTDNINGVIARDVVEGCYLDSIQQYCDLITRGGPPTTTDPSLTRMTLVGQPFINQDSQEAKGLDFEVSYFTDVEWFGGGETVSTRLLTSYLQERSNTVSGVKQEFQGYFGTPEWTALLSGSYNRGALSVSLSANYVSSQIINRNWNFLGTSTQWDVADNEVNPTLMFDARVGYDLEVAGSNVNLFATINNLFDKDPETYLATAFNTGAFSFSTGPGIGNTGDLRGRRYVVGAKFEF